MAWFFVSVLFAIGRADSVGWRYQPVLFDKISQQVHVFTDMGPGDQLYPEDSKEHWIGAFTSGQPLLGPGSKVCWTGEGLHGAWFLTIPFDLAFLVILPLTLPYRLIRWAVRRFKGTPRWSADILASVGEPAAPQRLRPQPKRQYTGDHSQPPKLPFKHRRAQAKRRKPGEA